MGSLDIVGRKRLERTDLILERISFEDADNLEVDPREHFETSPYRLPFLQNT